MLQFLNSKPYFNYLSFFETFDVFVDVRFVGYK